MPYYISTGRQLGPGVALTLVVPRAGVVFTVGAATRAAARSLLATLRYVSATTSYDEPPRHAVEAREPPAVVAALLARMHRVEGGYGR